MAIDRAVEEFQQLKAKVEGPRSRLTTREGIAEDALRDGVSSPF